MIFRFKGRDFNAKCDMFRNKHVQNVREMLQMCENEC